MAEGNDARDDLVNFEIQSSEGVEPVKCSFCCSISDSRDEGSTGEEKLRLLPCKCRQLICYSCFKDTQEAGGVKCSSCSFECFADGYSQLELLTSEPRKPQPQQPNEDIRLRTDCHTEVRSFKCDKCKDTLQPAKKYCTEKSCQERYCERHLQSHDSFYEGEDHTIIDEQTYLQNPHLHRVPSTCRLSGHIDHACTKCFKRSCASCGPDHSNNIPCKDAEGHKWESEGAVDKEVTNQFRRLEELLSEKMVSYGAATNNVVDKNTMHEERDRRLLEDVTSQEEYEIRRSRRHSLKMQCRIQTHRDQNVGLYAGYQQYAQDKMDVLRTLQEEIQELHIGNPLNKFDKFEDVKERITNAVEEGIDECCWREPLAFVLTDYRRQGERNLIEVPKAIHYIVQCHCRTTQCCYDVAMQGNKTLWVAHEHGLSYYDLQPEDSHQQLLCRPKKANGEFICTAVAPYKANVYFTVESKDGNEGQVKACLRTKQDCGKAITLFTYESDTSQPADLAASDNLLALTNSREDKVILYNLATEEKNSYTLADKPRGVCFHPNGNLLVTDHTNGTLTEYTLNSAGEPERDHPVVCRDLTEPDAICVDSTGLIYVKSTSKKLVYIISEGMTHKPLVSDDIHVSHGGITTNGNYLWMAGYAEKEFRCFSIQFDD